MRTIVRADGLMYAHDENAVHLDVPASDHDAVFGT